MQAQASSGWHVAQWGRWGWIETGLKLLAIIAGVVAFFGANDTDAFEVGGNPHLAALILLVIMTLATVGVVGFRFIQKEISSFAFAIANLIGHLGLLYSLLRTPEQETLPIVFGIFYVLGEAAKQRFLIESGYTEGGQSTGAMLNTSRAITALYIIFAVLVLI